jgi:PKD repeat protein
MALQHQYYTYANAGENCVIKNNTTSSDNIGPYWGFFLADQNGNTDDDYNIIDGNEIKDWGVYGIRTYYSDIGTQIINNELHNEDNPNSNNTQFGIYMYEFRASGEVLIANNWIHDMCKDGIGSKYGIYLYGYEMGGDDPSYIVNNIIDLPAERFTYGIYCYSYFTSEDVNILHNTLYLKKEPNQTNNSTVYGLFCGYMNGNVENNIIYCDYDKTAGTLYGIYTYDYNSGYGPSNFSNNNIHLEDMTGSGTIAYAYDPGNGGVFTTYNDMTSAFGRNWYNESVGFADRANGDYRVSSFGLCNAGRALRDVPLDFYGNTRSTTTPDIGAAEFFLDIEVASVDVSTNVSECGNFSTPIGITIENNSAYPVSNIPVAYEINGSVVSEVVNGPIASGSSSSYTFDAVPTFNTPGTNVIDGYVDGIDDDATNNEDDYTFNIIASPAGGDLTAGAVFEGYFRSGNMADPDVTVNDYALEYDITRPNKYSGQAPGTDYTYTLNAMTTGGTTLGSADGFDLNGEVVEIDPSTSLAGSTIWFEVSVLDNATGCDTSYGRYMYVPHVPEVSFDAGSGTVCLGVVAEYKNNSTLDGSDYMLQSWDFDDPDASVLNDTSDIADGFWDYTTYGTADVSLTVWNGVYPKFKYNETKTVTVTPKPELDFKVLNACEGTAIQFNNNSVLPGNTGGTINYSWNFGDGNTSMAESPTHVYSTPGQRVVTLTGVSNGCVSRLSKNAYQFEKPEANFTSIGACNFEDIEFVNASTIPNDGRMGYSWDFGDGGISRQPSPMHAFATPGSKTVTLKATSEFGCEDTYTASITLAESPEADFEWDAACNLTPVQFTRTGSVPGDGSGSTYSWDFNGMGMSGDENPSYLFSEIGPKNVTLTINDLNGCSSSITKELNVVLQAVADFEVADVCEGSDAVFTNKSTVAAGNLDYVWNFGAPSGATSTDLSPRFAYPVTGQTRIVNVTLQANVPGGCSDEVTKSLTVNATPDADFEADVEGRTVIITGPAGNDIYQWTFGDGGKSTDENPVYTYSNVDQGTFEVCLGTRNAECWSENCETITINLVGIEDLTVNNAMINVYPNPSNGAFTLEVSEASEDAVIKIADILGNEVSFGVVDNLNGKYSINLEGVAAGVYFVQVKNGDFYATKRITVNK